MDPKRSWKDVPQEERWQYFKDYYLVKTLIAVCVLIVAVILIRDIVTPEPVYALQIGVYDTSLSEEEKTELAHKIQKQLHVYDEVGIDDAYTSLNDSDLMRIVSLSESGDLDLIIAPREVFTFLAGYGYFKDLEASCSETFLHENGGRLVICKGLTVSEDGLLAENAEGSGEPYAAGITAEGTLFEPYMHGMKDPVIGVIYESEHLPYFEALAQ